MKKITVLKNILVHKLRLFASLGFTYTCPLCHWHARFFVTDGLSHPVLKKYDVIGAGRRKNAKCPRCGSKERDRFIFLFLKKRGLLNDTSKKILHIAPEKKLGPLLRAQFGKNYTSTDLNTPTVDVRADIQALPFPNESYDLILCNHVLEHIPNDGQALTELFRVLRHGGVLIAQIPFSPLLEETIEDATLTDPRKREERFGQDDHVRLYGTDFQHRFTNVGFTIRTMPLTDFLSEAEIKKYALNVKEPLIIATKV